ncbi:MAG: hypothetical protein HYS35_03955 [Betaproteobacteria bacterium]|nr:hypothetical protein [Betaproteobacteria bacterium]
MNRFPPDLLIYVLLIAGILLFNYLAQRAARSRQTQAAGGEPPAQDAPLEEIFRRAQPLPAADPVPASAPAPARARETHRLADDVPRRRSAARGLLKGRRDLQRAIVLAAVLGPCRALEPPLPAPGGAGVGNGGRALKSGSRS